MNKKTAQEKKPNNYKIIPTPSSLLTPWYEWTTIPPTPPPPPVPPIPFPIIYKNDTMDKELLVQMRQSNKYGSVRNDEILNLHLRSGAGPWVNIPWLLQDSIYWFHPLKQLTRKMQSAEMRFNSQQLVSYCLGLHTQKPGLRVVDLESSPRKGSDKINMLN